MVDEAARLTIVARRGSKGGRRTLGRGDVGCVLGVALWIAFVLPAAAQGIHVKGACREGLPHGAWELVAADGSLRALGAFNRGKRTGSFIFWNDAGVRVAHVPFEDDAKSGTLAVWYPRAAKGAEAPKRLEAVYTDGKLNGTKRAWHPDGRLRGEYTYVSRDLVDAKAWDTHGRGLPAAQAREQAVADAASHDAYYATLDALVQRYLPVCKSAAARPVRGRGPPELA